MIENKILPTLASQVRRQISIRILICMILLLISLCVTIVYGMFGSFNLIEKEITKNCDELANFVISQTLLNNPEAINLKLKSLNSKEYNYRLIINNSQPMAQQMRWRPFFAWSYIYPIYDLRNRYFGYFIVKGSLLDDQSFMTDIITRGTIIFLFAGIIFSLLLPLSRKIPERLFMQPIKTLLMLLRNRENHIRLPCKNYSSLEMQEIYENMLELIKQSEIQAKESALYELAHQVAHDIRSPLVAMDMVLSFAAELPEDKRTLLRLSISRVHDIANNLLENNKRNVDIHKNEPCLLSALVMSIVNEKIVQLKNDNILIRADICPKSYGIFLNINQGEFKRVLSNLINNSVEAAVDKAIIIIKLKKFEMQAIISIIDNGVGIPANILHQLGQKGLTYNKVNGSGLGLYHAFNCIKAWNGEISIESKQKIETKVIITLPLITPPNWFIENIVLKSGSTVAILDDDPNIHIIWKNRFSQLNCELIHACRQEEIISLVQNSQHTLHKILFLIDYEIIKSPKNGLELIKELSIEKYSILVTSRDEEPEIQRVCNENNIFLLPKSLSITIPITMI